MTVTRWWLEGDRDSGVLTLIEEHGGDDDPPCPIVAPDRPHMHPDTDLRGPGPDRPWLFAGGIGVMRAHMDGAHGWIGVRSTQRFAPRPKTKSRRRRLPGQGAML